MKKGFTLVELIASLAIFSLAMLTVTMGFSIALKTLQMNDIKQNTASYSQAITENLRVLGYDKLNFAYPSNNSVVSTFLYFNDMGNLNLQKYINLTTIIIGNVNGSTYPLSLGNKFGTLIKITKTSVGGIMLYHIYVRVWALDKGIQSQSVRDIYESR